MAKLRRVTRRATATAGFTLLEVLVVVIMIGVIAAIAAPSWFAYFNRQRVSRAASDITQVLQQAQSDAQQKSVQRVVTIASDYTLEVSSASGVAGAVTEIEEPGGDVEIAGLNTAGAATELIFDYEGVVDSDSTVPFVFSVTNDRLGNDSARCVVVTTLLGNLVQAEGANCDPAVWVE